MYKPEASSISKQRRPNSLHHKCGLLSEWFIRGTYNLRTQPCGRHCARNTNAPRDSTLIQKKWFRNRAATIQPGAAGCQAPKGNDRQHIGTSILVKAASRQLASTPRNDAHGHLHNDGGLHSPRFPQASKSKLNHMHTLATRTADMNNLRWTKTSPHVRHTKHLTCSTSVQFFLFGATPFFASQLDAPALDIEILNCDLACRSHFRISEHGQGKSRNNITSLLSDTLKNVRRKQVSC